MAQDSGRADEIRRRLSEIGVAIADVEASNAGVIGAREEHRRLLHETQASIAAETERLERAPADERGPIEEDIRLAQEAAQVSRDMLVQVDAALGVGNEALRKLAAEREQLEQELRDLGQ